MADSKPDHNFVRRLTPSEVAELRRRNALSLSDRRRRAGIEELRRALNDRFGAPTTQEIANG